jgi:tetratricopeptide (TPR) repeat protein
MRRFPIVLSALALIGVVSPPWSQAQAQRPEMQRVSKDAFVYYNYGILHYQARDYASAAKSLEQAVNSGMSKSPAARYVLGNALFLTDKKEQAWNNYATAVQTDPIGQAGIYSKYCMNWLAADAKRKQVEEIRQPSVKIDDSAIKTELPKCPSVEMDRPSMYEVSQWTDLVRAQYAAQAQAKIQEAYEKSNAAKRLYVQAQGTVNQWVPTTQDRNEGAGGFQRRKQAYVDKGQQLLRPYQDYAIACQEHFKDANKIAELCRLSQKKLNAELPSN